ncbi:MAG TPA: alcohol dehydrogenase catalytic domain-containing protein [Steroidobacteraceae bacterium]|nr:alcohol dehydrogenase catalytic domain-containing protein [Steroidobacteraceae bacterium]
MKAAVFTMIGKPLSIESLPDPAPQRDEVLVRVDRCGICGSDLHMTADPSFAVPAGTVIGHEWAGEVVEVGPTAQRVKRGDRVAVLPVRSCGRCPACAVGEPAWCAEMRIDGGGYGQLALASERQCLVLPRTVSLHDGALIEPLAVGLHGINVSEMPAGARVLVIGAGPIGLAATFWARRLGAGVVAVTASSMTRAELARAMGASVFIDPARISAAQIQSALRGPPDIVFECVGKPGLIRQSLEYVRPRGTVVVLGLCTALDSFVPFVAVAKEVRIQPAALYRMRDFEIAADVMDQGDVTPRAMVTDTVSLEELPPAFEALRRRSHQCKVLIDPWA